MSTEAPDKLAIYVAPAGASDLYSALLPMTYVMGY